MRHPLRRIIQAGLLIAMPAVLVAQQLIAVPTGTYLVDTSNSKVTAKVGYFGVSNMSVQFPRVSGTLDYDARLPASIKLDVNVDATALDGGSDWNNDKLRGDEFFDVKNYPAINFRGTKLTMKTARTATVDGNITVRGISRPSTLFVTFQSALTDIGRTGRVAMVATTRIRRSDFNMTAYSGIVAEKVALTINVAMVRR